MRLTWLILHGEQRHRCAPEAECPHQATRSPTRRAFGGIHTPTMKQPTSMWLFPHQQAEKSPQNQHVLSILQVGCHQLQYRFFRTNKPKSRNKTNTLCPLTRNGNIRVATRRQAAPNEALQPTKTPTFRCSKTKQSHFQQHIVSYNPSVLQLVRGVRNSKGRITVTRLTWWAILGSNQ